MASGLGVRFVAMARSHARMLREMCIETRRRNLGAVLYRKRNQGYAALPYLERYLALGGKDDKDKGQFR